VPMMDASGNRLMGSVVSIGEDVVTMDSIIRWLVRTCISRVPSWAYAKLQPKRLPLCLPVAAVVVARMVAAPVEAMTVKEVPVDRVVTVNNNKGSFHLPG